MAKLLLGSVVGPQGPQGTPGVNGSQGPQGVPGPNEIAATTEVAGLTTGQLLYNNGGKVGSIEIVDNKNTDDSGKPLSARMGYLMGSQLYVIEQLRGYIYAKEVTDFDQAIDSGKYKAANAYNQPVSGTLSWVIDVINNGAGGISQIATCVSGASEGKIYSRFHKIPLTWSAWKEIPDKSYVDSAIGQISNDLTAHKASTVYTVWQISRDLSISGDQIISGIGFKPKAVIAISAVLAEVGKFSTGFSGGVGNTIGIFDFPNVPGSYGADATLIQIQNSYTQLTKAIVKSFDTDGLTLTWSKAGTGATGTCLISLLVFGH